MSRKGMANAIDLINIYKRRCMLTGIRNDLTFHHIIKEEHRGPRTIENGGLLYNGVHQWQHNYAERKDKQLYIETNLVIVDYKKFYIERPSWFEGWVEEVNQFYINRCIEYYHNKHNMGVVKVLRRELSERK